MTLNALQSSAYDPILEGQHNFRDLGGLPAGNGFTTKYGTIYRSGDLSSITDKDIATLEKLGLAMVIDFRSERERMKSSNRIIRSVRETKNITINDSARDEAANYLAKNDAYGLENLLINDYRRIIRENQEEYRLFLFELAVGSHSPVVFHCTAGKDRTGLAAVFLLTALGVDFNVIFADYLTSNIRNTIIMSKLINHLNEKGHNGEIMRPLLEVKKEYLQAALEEIQENHGGLQAFVEGTLEANTVKLRERFLEPVGRRS